MHRAGVMDRLAAYRERHPEERTTVDRFASFVASEPRCFERDCWRGHVTGSAWLVDAEGVHVLLTHHAKLDRWLQLGGHSDGDPDTLRVACREAEEESGLVVRPIDVSIFDVDIHAIPARGDEPAHEHFDVRFALRASDRAFRTSAESKALRWVEVARINAFTTEPSMVRMAEKWRKFAGDRAP